MYELKATPPPRPRRQPGEVKPGEARRGDFNRGMTIGSVTFLIAAMLTVAGLLIAYATIASALPSPDELTSRTSTFQSMRILDREGNLLNEAFDVTNINAGRRTYAALNRISPYLRQATIATEDANFYEHSGIDYFALVRAVYYAVREGDVVSGASTIPQQLVKMLFLSPERSITRKIKEAVLSAEISREYPKDKILETYLNEINYGNLAYGAEAAAETYFGQDVADLTLAQAALLAGLPQAPAYYDPYANPDRAKGRQGVVLALMVEAGFVSPDEADRAWLEPLVYIPVTFDLKSPHFTLFVRQQLESLLGPEAMYQSGLSVTTSLDPRLQAEAERIVREQVALVADRNVSNGALVAIRPETGEILALVGSADFNNVEIDGQVNMALAPRQPGSTIKPFVYLTAFEQRDRPVAEHWTPGTLVADIRTEFPDGANPPYVPTNYDNRERGLVTVRRALGNSLNIPAVSALQTVGLPAFLDMTRRLGITTLTRPDYGLSLSLGAGEIPLVEMTGAFGVLANQGRYMAPITILKIVDSTGLVRCEQGSATPCQPNANSGQQMISAVDAFLMTTILSDNNARAEVFGPNSLLRLDRPAAAKTGTTNDFRDVLTMGYTPQLVTGVWVGNSDNSAMINISGITGAAPIWNEFMRVALANQPALEFPVPAGVRQVEVCTETGTQPSEACPERSVQWFADDRLPLAPERDLYQKIKLDKLTGKLATEFTPADAIEEQVFKVYPDQYRQWAEDHGIPQPPKDASDVYTGEAQLVIRVPVEGEIVSGVVTVWGSADAPAFASYELQYGISHDPGAFSPPISGPYGNPVIDNILGQWDTTGLQDGPHTLRLVVRDRAGAEREQRVRVFVTHETAPAVEPTPTWTVVAPTPTLLALPTDTPTPVVEMPTPEPTWTLPPPPETPTPEPTWTLPPVETPTAPIEPPLEATPTWTPETSSAGTTAGGVLTETLPLTTTEGVTATTLMTVSAGESSTE
ncbi:MAG: transglycosylase domain-containing protein [Caldilineaceae bacterium]|nr:transglycosylase domain-containing protein [Caldilineaceae bacterium]